MKLLRKIQVLVLILAALIAVGPAMMASLSGCSSVIPVARTAVTVLDKVEDASQYLDAAWNAFCFFKPSVCQQYGVEYQQARGILSAALLATRDSADAIATGEVRKAYASIEAFLMKLGVIVPAGSVGAPKDGWTPWTAPKI